jgi:SAM-dependent methyltransferase
MIEQARKLNPDISFQVGDMMALTLQDEAVPGSYRCVLYAIVNIPADSLRTVFKEMLRVLKPGGLLLLSFHIGNEVLRPDELLGERISMDFFFFEPIDIKQHLEAAGFTIRRTGSAFCCWYFLSLYSVLATRSRYCLCR